MYFFLLLLLSSTSSRVWSQASPPETDIDQLVQVPLSPEAGAFAKYGSVPVSMYTGTPQISVPLGSISGREMNVPISLTYDASGVKVDELASFAGLKWNLNVGGAITRRVLGIPDGYGAGTHRIFDPEMIQFLTEVDDENMIAGTGYPLDRIHRFYAVEDFLGKLDTDPQPDIFSFSVNGMAGTIYIHYDYDFVNNVDNTTAYCLENPNLLVEVTLSPSGNPVNFLTGWTITAEDGTKYRFDQQEVTIHGTEDNDFQNHTFEYTSAWYVSDIISPSGKDYVKFNYTTDLPWLNQQDLDYRVASDRTITFNHGATSNGPGCLEGDLGENAENHSQYLMRQSYLTSIEINGRMRAAFDYDGMPDRKNIGINDRADLNGRKRIKEINFYDVTGNGLLNTVEFEHSYFGFAGDPENLPSSTQEQEVRLKLDAVRILGNVPSATQQFLQEYSFEYIDPDNLPSRFFKGVDFWGYNNGAINNTSLIPRLPEITMSDGTVLDGANRNPSFAHTQIGTLKKINYPTGGHTEFSYQLHSAPPTGNLVYEEVAEEILELTGGTSTTNEYNYDAEYLGLPTGPDFPIGEDDAFSFKDTDKPAKLLVEVIGTPSSFPANTGGQYIIVYKSGTGICTTNGPFTSCQYGIERDFAELNTGTLSSDQEIMIFDDPAIHGPSWEIGMGSWDEAGYRVLVLNRDPAVTVRVSFVKTVPTFQTSIQTVGGLRTYKVVDRSDPTTDALTRYYYYNNLKSVVDAGTSITPALFTGNYTASSVVHQPLAFHDFSVFQQCSSNGQARIECTSVNRYSSNQIQAVGPHIAYSTVTEVQYSDALGMNGFTVNQYFNEQEFHRDAPLPAKKLKNGNLQKNKIYDNAGTLLEETETFMSLRGVNPVPSTGIIKSTPGMVLYSPGNISFQGIRYTTTNSLGEYYFAFVEWCDQNGLTALPQVCALPTTSCVPGTFSKHTPLIYYNSSLWLRTDSTIRTQYFEGIPVRTETHFRYDEFIHRQVTEQFTFGSDGTEERTKVFYPDDMSFIPGTYSPQEESAIALLSKSNGFFHRISQPIWTETYTNGVRTSIQKATFVDLRATQSGPMGFLNVLPKSIATSNGNVNLLEEVSVFHVYDVEGNPLDVSRGRGPHIAYLWGQNASIPIAKVANAQVGEIAYTSFEGDDAGNWSVTVNNTNPPSPPTPTFLPGLTGQYARDLTNISATAEITLPTGLSERTYTVSYWKQGGPASVSGTAPVYEEQQGAWTYYEHEVAVTTSSFSVAVTGTGLLDELRLYPTDALMTTYCFDEASRLITTTDANSRATHYQYDGQNRLEEVRDFNNHLRQQVEYKLFNQ